LKLAAGKASEVHWMMWVVSVAFVVYFSLGVLKSWFGI